MNMLLPDFIKVGLSDSSDGSHFSSLVITVLRADQCTQCHKYRLLATTRAEGLSEHDAVNLTTNQIVVSTKTPFTP